MYDFVFGKIYPLVSDIAVAVFAIDLIIVLPISLLKKAKGISGTILFFSSYLFGMQLWLSGLMLSLQIWGIWAVIIGLLFFGVGVVPIAMIATLVTGKWNYFSGSSRYRVGKN
jgi:hypothetical protein